MMFFAVLISQDSQTWLYHHSYSGVAIFHDVEMARKTIDSIRWSGAQFQVVQLQAEFIP